MREIAFFGIIRPMPEAERRDAARRGLQDGKTLNMKNKYIVIAIALAAILGAGWLFFGKTSEPAPAQKAPAERKAEKPRHKGIPEAKNRKRPAKKTVAAAAADADKKADADDAEMSPQDQKTIDAIQDALDDENFARVKAQVDAAAQSANPEVRSRAVEALQWFGAEAMPELTLFMADADEDVRESACDAWTQALQQVNDPDMKQSLVSSAMAIVRDRGQLDFMVMEINDLSNARQIDVLEKLINGDNETAAEVAKEHYEFLTSEKYEGAEAAQKWLDENPE